MKIKSLILSCILFLTGCASGPSNYQLYADTQAKIAQANAVSDTARYNALLEIAKTGDSAAKVAAVLSIQMGQGSGARPQQQIAAPEDWDTKLLKWAGVVVPAAMQGLAIGAQIHAANTQRQVAVTQSNNALATAQSTNNTFAAMSQNAATSNTNIATAGFNAVTAGSTALVNVANSGLTATTTTAANGLNAAQNIATAGFTNSTTLGTAGITGVNTAANAGITGMNAAVANGNALTNNVATGYTTALQSAIAKLTGSTTTTTTTTTTSNTANTTTTNNVCPVGQAFTNGACI